VIANIENDECQSCSGTGVGVKDLCQGMTLVVPQTQQKQTWALAPEGMLGPQSHLQNPQAPPTILMKVGFFPVGVTWR
jgi:hypothetical protein